MRAEPVTSIHQSTPFVPEEGATMADWLALLKPRVISLVVFTGAAGMAVAPQWPPVILAFIDIFCICIGAGAAGAINMWYDRDIDAIMRRTSVRPIPDHRMDPDRALTYGIVLSVLSVILLWLASNALAAAILAFSIFFYAVIYTIWLKRRTPQNIVIGGAAGAFPPMIGYAAATGTLHLLPVIMFAIVFLWTPPHFWSLSLYACKDYTRAGIPMLPVVKGPRHTRWQILTYTVILVAASLVPGFYHLAGPLYNMAAGLLGLGFLIMALGVLRDPQDRDGQSLTVDKPARRAFRYSLLYLFLLFLALLIDRVFLS
ncbi:heme o synthase [Candidatus Kirkpatrickella diaphorinae]|uniref:Protoheme IX farnesyltransferase n=1 Tax=Candidatus Kirkpatrickella diaphorinae TaxID=2984322 RepID=A0ABY6GL25_9PROT|nr:heme o synthase [Candidatus Kirkpatrickella diaphorinae]UYH52155.1 heme o synthase [Candidatus Kirkpatrickella diaphorinae]